MPAPPLCLSHNHLYIQTILKWGLPPLDVEEEEALEVGDPYIPFRESALAPSPVCFEGADEILSIAYDMMTQDPDNRMPPTGTSLSKI